MFFLAEPRSRADTARGSYFMNLISISFEHRKVYFDDGLYIIPRTTLKRFFSEDMMHDTDICVPHYKRLPTQSLGWPPLGDISPEKKEF